MSFLYRSQMRSRVDKLTDRERDHGYSAIRRIEIRKAQLKLKTTKHEWMMRELLDALQYKYIFQKGFLDKGKIMIADFYLPKPRRIIIEIDGGSHTGREAQVKDAVRDAYFEERGFRILRITNQEMETLTIDELRTLIRPKKASAREAMIEPDAAFTNWARSNY